jgi:RimJ/RimL family protein N-acetyltransferase
MPSRSPHEPTPFEDWAAFVLDRPLFQAEGSFVAYADGEPAAVSFLTADLASGRGTNMYTGTLPEFRGRGLARAAKLGVLHWAAEHGITQVATTNDETNAPMLAINDRLGYRPAGRRVEAVRSPSASTPAEASASTPAPSSSAPVNPDGNPPSA